jgi:uncharacterized protein YndB with AHSA1/START domain
MSATTGTVRLHRVFSAPPERVYRAFLDPEAMVKWLPPNGFVAKIDHLEAKVGGTYKMSFKNFSTGTVMGFGGKYLQLKPHELIQYTDVFDDPNLSGEIRVTVTLKQVLVGTEVHIVQENLPAVIPVEACYLGWQDSLNQLAAIVNPAIPDGA